MQTVGASREPFRPTRLARVSLSSASFTSVLRIEPLVWEAWDLLYRLVLLCCCLENVGLQSGYRRGQQYAGKRGGRGERGGLPVLWICGLASGLFWRHPAEVVTHRVSDSGRREIRRFLGHSASRTLLCCCLILDARVPRTPPCSNSPQLSLTRRIEVPIGDPSATLSPGITDLQYEVQAYH